MSSVSSCFCSTKRRLPTNASPSGSASPDAIFFTASFARSFPCAPSTTYTQPSGSHVDTWSLPSSENASPPTRGSKPSGRSVKRSYAGCTPASGCPSPGEPFSSGRSTFFTPGDVMRISPSCELSALFGTTSHALAPGFFHSSFSVKPP